jgi:hypothetical protein
MLGCTPTTLQRLAATWQWRVHGDPAHKCQPVEVPMQVVWRGPETRLWAESTPAGAPQLGHPASATSPRPRARNPCRAERVLRLWRRPCLRRPLPVRAQRRRRPLGRQRREAAGRPSCCRASPVSCSTLSCLNFEWLPHRIRAEEASKQSPSVQLAWGRHGGCRCRVIAQNDFATTVM